MSPSADRLQSARRTAKGWRIASLVLTGGMMAVVPFPKHGVVAFYLLPLAVLGAVVSGVLNARAKILAGKERAMPDDPPGRVVVREVIAETLIAGTLVGVSCAAWVAAMVLGLGHL